MTLGWSVSISAALGIGGGCAYSHVAEFEKQYSEYSCPSIQFRQSWTFSWQEFKKPKRDFVLLIETNNAGLQYRVMVVSVVWEVIFTRFLSKRSGFEALTPLHTLKRRWCLWVSFLFAFCFFQRMFLFLKASRKTPLPWVSFCFSQTLPTAHHRASAGLV